MLNHKRNQELAALEATANCESQAFSEQLCKRQPKLLLKKVPLSRAHACRLTPQSTLPLCLLNLPCQCMSSRQWRSKGYDPCPCFRSRSSTRQARQADFPFASGKLGQRSLQLVQQFAYASINQDSNGQCHSTTLQSQLFSTCAPPFRIEGCKALQGLFICSTT